jgi:hypothetical protein
MFAVALTSFLGLGLNQDCGGLGFCHEKIELALPLYLETEPRARRLFDCSFGVAQRTFPGS